MRRWLCVALAATVLGRGLSAQQKPDFTAAGSEVTSILTGLVKIDTSNPPGNEIKAV